MIVREDFQFGEVAWVTSLLNIGAKAADIYAQRESFKAQEDALKAQKQIMAMQQQIEQTKAEAQAKKSEADILTAALKAKGAAVASGTAKDNTILYVGLGVGAIVILGMGFMLVKGKK